MKALTGKRFWLLLESRGSQLKRIRGNHHIFVKTGIALRVSVPVHRGTLKRGLQRHLMKLAQIRDSELQRTDPRRTKTEADPL
ncbi:MAG: type II toxin-antitoxin system HicA family toxin [Bryobacterales bacterium]|nr:type II toxin-antitoxin system HicA family toxin [Bryobacterales bacterium]